VGFLLYTMANERNFSHDYDHIPSSESFRVMFFKGFMKGEVFY